MYVTQHIHVIPLEIVKESVVCMTYHSTTPHHSNTDKLHSRDRFVETVQLLDCNIHKRKETLRTKSRPLSARYRYKTHLRGRNQEHSSVILHHILRTPVKLVKFLPCPVQRPCSKTRNSHPCSMIIMKTKYVVPLRIDWLAMLLMIGIFGFLAQVRTYPHYHRCRTWLNLVLGSTDHGSPKGDCREGHNGCVHPGMIYKFLPDGPDQTLLGGVRPHF